MNDPGLDGPLQEAAESSERTLRKRLGRRLTGRIDGGRATNASFRREQKEKRHRNDGYFQPKRWWFTATAFPLIAGTFGPIANLMSVCALVQSWREKILPGQKEANAIRVPDPKWLLAVNAISLAFAICANLFLLLNFAHRMRYAIAQPLTIIFWYIASFLLMALVVAAHKHLRLLPEDHTFSQSFYYAIISAITYFIISTLLLWNLLGAWAFKKYPPTFTSLTISQRTLMLQTVSYSLYIALGAGIFSSLEGWSFVDGVYWADYTLLTIGLGSDFAPKRLVSKALLIPYAVVGVIMIGLIVGSVRGLFLERGKIKVRRRAIEKERRKTLKRLDRQDSETDFKHEFELMRGVQNVADRVRRWFGLGTSFAAFLIVWLGGAVAFMLSERKEQDWDYFQALYFTYTSLLTIGYGDFYPRSNFGKPFFVIWSLIAVPTVTILISNMGDTVVSWVKKGTLWLGQKTILPERKKFRGPHKVNNEIEEAKGREESRKKPAKKQIQRDVERLANVVGESEKRAEEDPNERNETNKLEHHLGRKIAKEISSLARDIGSKPPRKYEWEEWKRFLELLGQPHNQQNRQEDDDSKWRWLGHDGPLLSGVTETEWILAKMCERLEEVLVQEKVI